MMESMGVIVVISDKGYHDPTRDLMDSIKVSDVLLLRSFLTQNEISIKPYHDYSVSCLPQPT